MIILLCKFFFCPTNLCEKGIFTRAHAYNIFHGILALFLNGFREEMHSQNFALLKLVLCRSCWLNDNEFIVFTVSGLILSKRLLNEGSFGSSPRGAILKQIRKCLRVYSLIYKNV